MRFADGDRYKELALENLNLWMKFEIWDWDWIGDLGWGIRMRYLEYGLVLGTGTKDCNYELGVWDLDQGFWLCLENDYFSIYLLI